MTEQGTSTEQGTAGSAVIAALIAGVTIYGLAMGVTYPLLGIVLAAELSVMWNGVNAAATGLGLLLGVVLVPPLGRRIGAGATVLAGVALMAGSLLALSAVQDFRAVFALRLLLGCGANLMFVVAETALNVFAPPERRGRVMGVYSAAVALGFVVGPTVVAAMPGEPSLLLLACAAVTALAILPLSRAGKAVGRSVCPAPLGRIGRAVVAFPFAFWFVMVASAIDAVAISLLPVIALDQGYSAETGALFVAVFHFGLLVGLPAVGVVLDIAGRRQTVLGCCVLSFCSAGALVFAAQLGFWPVACIMFIWGGMNYGLYTAGLTLIGDRFAGELLTAATAAFAAVYAVASVAGPVVAGLAIDGLGAEGFYAAIAAIYFCTLLGGVAFFQPLELRRCRG